MKQIRLYIDRAFDGVPASEQADQLKEEIIRDLEEKAADLIQGGKTEEDAVNKVLVQFGDIEELKQELDLPPESANKRKELARVNLNFSIWGSLLILALVVFINFYYTPHIIWFIYPAFAVAWWPLTMFYAWYRIKSGE
ncbi:MAG: permease prefix domain 1-containing protein [Sporolactobacillus sp.]